MKLWVEAEALYIYCSASHETIDARSNLFRDQQWFRLTSTALLSEVVRSSFYSVLTEGIVVLEQEMGVPCERENFKKTTNQVAGHQSSLCGLLPHMI